MRLSFGHHRVVATMERVARRKDSCSVFTKAPTLMPGETMKNARS